MSQNEHQTNQMNESTTEGKTQRPEFHLPQPQSTNLLKTVPVAAVGTILGKNYSNLSTLMDETGTQLTLLPIHAQRDMTEHWRMEVNFRDSRVFLIEATSTGNQKEANQQIQSACRALGKAVDRWAYNASQSGKNPRVNHTRSERKDTSSKSSKPSGNS